MCNKTPGGSLSSVCISNVFWASMSNTGPGHLGTPVEHTGVSLPFQLCCLFCNIFFSFYSLVLWKPDLRLRALMFYVSNSVSFLCSQMCLHSCSLGLNKKDVCTAGKRIFIYLWPEMWRMEWPDGHYLNPQWLQTFWSSRGDNWTRKPTLKFASLSNRLQIKSPVTFLT